MPPWLKRTTRWRNRSPDLDNFSIPCRLAENASAGAALAGPSLPRPPALHHLHLGRTGHNLYEVRPDFVYSVSREFVRNCPTPMLVLPDDTPAHAYQTAIDVASLAPNADISVYPWKDPPELKARTINRVRNFLKAHLPATAAR